MSQPSLKLGGLAITDYAGSPELTEQPIGGETSLRLSGGALVSMRHWSKMAGSISAAGWMPPALDALDFDQPLELLSTKVRVAQGGTSLTLPATPRPDKVPWAYAVMSDRSLVPTNCITTGRAVSVTAVAGAVTYQVWFMPKYTVKCTRPAESQQGGQHSWQLDWEEC